MALNVDELENQIKELLQDILPNSLEIALRGTFSDTSEEINETCKKFGEDFCEQFIEPFSQGLASAIDYHVRSAEVHGSFMIMGIPTAGSPYSHMQCAPVTVTVDTLPVGTGGGQLCLPNNLMLGIK